jgi:hypothetical protein
MTLSLDKRPQNTSAGSDLWRTAATRLLGIALPACLAVANALFWYFPKPNLLMGWGDDPHFNLWVHEHHWAVFSRSGPLAFLATSFWDSNIFYPLPLTIALSDNYVASSLLSWPLRLISGNGAQSLSLLCVLGNVAAFFCMAQWLRTLGAIRLAFWGGLAFAACGWVQTQSAHFQNACIFVFPLALWMYSRFVEKPSIRRLAACALAFGWIIGWNLYYQTFANIILLVLAIATAYRRPELKLPLLALLVATVLVESPIAYRYFRLQSIMGDYAVGMGDFRYFAARWTSVFFHYFHRNWIQIEYPNFYPATKDATIESAGFIGFTWLIYWFRTLFAKRSVRLWAWAGVAAWLVALGPDYWLFRVVHYFPGMSSLRAIGRAQIVSTLFSIAAIILLLENHLIAGRRRIWAAIVPMLLIIAELTPGRARDTVEIRRMPWVPADTARKIAEQHAKSMLVLPDTSPSFQLYFAHVPIKLYSGYSGRTPVQAGLVYQTAGSVSTPEQVEKFLDFVQPPLIAATNSIWRSLLNRTPGFEPLGCYSATANELCLFRALPQILQRWRGLTRINLERDAKWSYDYDNRHVRGTLQSTIDGTLDAIRLSSCNVIEHMKYPLLPEIHSKQRLESCQFKGASVPSGGTILSWTSPHSIFDLPELIRPTERFEISCTNE